MPIGFLPPADRDRLNGFPTQIPDDDLRAFFLLSEADQQVIKHQREAHTPWGLPSSSVRSAIWDLPLMTSRPRPGRR